MATFEEIMAMAAADRGAAQAPVPTPTPTPRPITTPSVSQVPTEAPGFLSNMILNYPTNYPGGEMVQSLARGLYSNKTQQAAELYPPTVEQAIPAMTELAGESAGLAGSITGARLGAPLGLPGVVGGGALGYALTSTPVKTALDYFTGSQKTEQERVDEAAKTAEISAAIDVGLRSLPGAAKYVGRAASALARPIKNYIGPTTTEKASEVISNALSKLGLDYKAAETAAKQKEALVKANPSAKSLTTAEITNNPNLAVAEDVLSKQPVAQANIKLADQGKQVVDDVNNQVSKLITKVDQNPKVAGENIIKLFKETRKQTAAKAGALFTDTVRETPVPINEFKKGVREARNLYKEFYKETGVPNSKVSKIIKQINGTVKSTGKAPQPVGFGRAPEAVPLTEPKITVGQIHAWASKLSEIGRKTNDAKLKRFLNGTDGYVKKLYSSIDNLQAGKELSAAREAWKKFADDFYRGPLKNIEKKTPEDVVKFIRSKSKESDAFNKIIGVKNADALSEDMSKFVALGKEASTPKAAAIAQLEWIQAKRAVYEGTPIWPTLQRAQQTLSKVINTTKLKGTAPNANVENLQNLGIDSPSLLRALGASGESRLLADKLTPNSGMIAGTAKLLGRGLLGRSAQKSTNLTGEQLLKALQDPKAALQIHKQAVKSVRKDRLLNVFANRNKAEAVEKFNDASTVISRALSSPSDKLNRKPVAKQQTPVAKSNGITEQQRQRLLKLKSLVNTPSIDDIITEATSQEGITISPSLVKKVIKQESGGKQEAKSKKGAMGLMQLMPDTAKELGVDPKDPKSNVMGGVRYLNQMMGQFQDEKLALAAYNWGPGNLNKALKRVEDKGAKPTWENVLKYASVPSETENYVNDILNKG